ncbi:MAG: T9SS type A sorting domain-containing protein [bacterium]
MNDHHRIIMPAQANKQSVEARAQVRSRLVFIIIGIVSMLWFFLRVIPKPNRVTYPCVRAAAPVMSGFILYLLGVTGTLLAFKNALRNFRNARYCTAALLLFITLGTIFLSFTGDQRPVFANSILLLGPNQPVGIPRGIFPGRVVWVWDPQSTNESCTNVFGDGWFMDKNTNGSVVNTMVADAVAQLAGKGTIKESWDALFKYFNQAHGKGNVGYTDGEKIFIRTNQVSASSGTYDDNTYEIKNQSRYGMAETSPHVVLAVLRQLVNACGVKQENISVGDPMKHMYKHVYDLWHNEFPNIVYIDADARLGRTAPRASNQPVIYYSDRGQILKSGGSTGTPILSDYYPTVITEASYLITIPALKAHARGGVTLCGKIHFGSNLRGSATHLHGGLIAPEKVTNTSTMRPGYGLYRVQVDLMGHKDLGEKTVLFLIDALWGGSEANDPPRKFEIPPFNKDWTSSVFASQDQVAIESVCFDFLKAEYTSSNPYGSYPQVPGADDHILQAADATYWPAGFRYDPENDGSPIPSLGVCEHWNNAMNKQYSKNLGPGAGIELHWINKTLTSIQSTYTIPGQSFRLFQNYPNPFNPTTTINYQLSISSIVTLDIFDIQGRKITTLVDEMQEKGEYAIEWNARTVPSGMYFYRLTAGKETESKKLILQR